MEKEVNLKTVLYSELFMDKEKEPKINFSMFIGLDQEHLINLNVELKTLIESYIKNQISIEGKSKDQVAQEIQGIKSIFDDSLKAIA